jgi:arylsulfatase A-like enzyme
VHGDLQVPDYYNQTYCAGVAETQSADRQTHCAMMVAMDEGIGNFTRALDELGYSKNLLTLFISDNGGPVNIGIIETLAFSSFSFLFGCWLICCGSVFC